MKNPFNGESETVVVETCDLFTERDITVAITHEAGSMRAM